MNLEQEIWFLLHVLVRRINTNSSAIIHLDQVKFSLLEMDVELMLIQTKIKLVIMAILTKILMQWNQILTMIIDHSCAWQITSKNLIIMDSVLI